MTSLLLRLARLYRELRRRHVVRVAVIYILMGAGLVEFSATVLPRLGVGDWAVSLVLFLVAIGLPISLVAAWALELSPDGEIQVTRPASEEGAGPADPDRPRAEPSRELTRRADRKLAYVGLGIMIGIFTIGAYAVTSGPSAEMPASSIRSIAVLPFADLSAGGGNAYLGAGVAEELLNALSEVRGLKIAARTSSFLFESGGADVHEIGERLDVQAVLGGSVTRVGDRLRIRAQLMETGEGFQVWSDTYDHQIDDLLALQTEIAQTIVDSLQIRFRPRGAATHDADPAAYERYLRARHAAGSRREPDLRRAAALYREALEIEPGLARAAAGLSFVNALLLGYGEGGADVTAGSTLEDAETALAMDPGLWEAQVARGVALAAMGRDRAAADAFQAAIAANPNSAAAHHLHAQLLERNGDAEGAAAARSSARSLDPLAGAGGGSAPRAMPTLPGA